MNMPTNKLNPAIKRLQQFALILATLLVAAWIQQAIPVVAGNTGLFGIEPGDPYDVVLLVREPQHLRAALKTADELRSGAEPETGTIEIIVCGKASSSLQAGSEMEAALREAAGEDVVITACGMSLKQTGIDPATLIDIVQVVPNGLTRALQLQAEGYLSVEL